MKFSAVILAGGKSSRMGRDKALLDIDGQTLLARQIQLARETGAAEIFVSGRADMDYSVLDCHVLLDKFPNVGPLAGIERALDSATQGQLLVLAVDLPQMGTELLRWLASTCSETCGAIPKLANHLEPLVAFYPKSAQKLATMQIAGGHFAAKDFAGLCVQSGLAGVIEMPIGVWHHFVNWNSPADFHLSFPT
jgi:molybdopterin-guanine dinucleotide biosynthesis protein A